jgi:hypothetical protein
MMFDMDSFFADLDEIMDSNPIPGNCNGWEPEHTDHTETENECEIIQ